MRESIQYNIVKWAIKYTLYGHDRDIYDFKAHLNQLIYWIMLIVLEPGYVNVPPKSAFPYYSYHHPYEM